jgi:hypothetical protein
VPNASAVLHQTDYDVFNGYIYLACADDGEGVDANPHYYAVPPVDPYADPTSMVKTEGTNRGYFIRTYQSKIYAVNDKYLHFSAINNPLLWEAELAGPVDITAMTAGTPLVCTVGVGEIGKFRNGMSIMISGCTGPIYEWVNGQNVVSGIDTGAGTFVINGDTTGATPPLAAGATADAVPATGRGFINLSTQDASGEVLKTVEVYYDKLALFTTQATQIWAIDPDPAQNAFEQLLRGAGAVSSRSALQYGSGDVLYLDPSGIRSVRARDSSNSAAVSDIGSPIDPVIQALRDAYGSDYIGRAISLLEPSVGRFWMVFPDQVMVLSYFPGPQITAWSTFTLPFQVTQAVTCNGKVFIRAGNTLYVYGGNDGKAYDNCGVEIRMPYLDGKKPGHKKQFTALDATVSGTWRIAISYDFNNPDAEETVATVSYPTGGGTWNSGSHEVTGYDSHFSIRLYNNDALPATVSNVAIHYEPGAFEE